MTIKFNSGISRAFMRKRPFNPIRSKLRWFQSVGEGSICFTKLKDLHNLASMAQKSTL